MQSRRIQQLALSTVAVGAVLATPLVALSGTAYATPPPTTSITTAGETPYTVPVGFHWLRVELVGAPGASTSSGGVPPGSPGAGADIHASIPVTAGSTIYAEVGAPGDAGGGTSVFAAAGGGESALQLCVAGPSCTYTGVPSTDPRLIVAGGGGGGGEGSFGNAGGKGGNAGNSAAHGPGAGAAGTDTTDGLTGGSGGLSTGATAAAIGADSSVCAGTTQAPATVGTPGIGGAGSDANGGNSSNGGGGGGGWVGGSGGGAGDCGGAGAAGAGGGGGGGGSFIRPTARGATMATAGSSAFAKIVITPIAPPTISSHVTGTTPISSFGWYHTGVTITYSCGAGVNDTLPAGACPAAVALNTNGIHKVVRTVTDNNGLSATATNTVKIDETKPSVKVKGVTSGHTYSSKRHLRCRAHDALSGIASCKIHTHKKHVNGLIKVNYKAVATDKAGNKRSVKGFYKIA